MKCRLQLAAEQWILRLLYSHTANWSLSGCWLSSQHMNRNTCKWSVTTFINRRLSHFCCFSHSPSKIPCVHVIHNRLTSSWQSKAISKDTGLRGLNDRPLRLTIQLSIREVHCERQEVLQNPLNSEMNTWKWNQKWHFSDFNYLLIFFL